MKTHNLFKRKPSTWKCICGCITAKKGASLSGGHPYSKDYHVHCPKCSRTVAQFVDPKETQVGAIA